jgi:hypothetical protein
VLQSNVIVPKHNFWLADESFSEHVLATRYSHFADNEYRRQFDAAESSKETNNMPSAPRIASK